MAHRTTGGLALQYLIGIGGGIPVNVTLPVIVGTAQVGAVLHWFSGIWTDPSNTFAKQWYVAGVAIAGATNDRYTPTTNDVGKAITVSTTATNPAGLSATVASAATAAVLSSDGGSGSSPGGGPNNTADHADPNNAYLLALMAA